MKIRKPKIETKYFVYLEPGDSFMFNNEMYMKTKTVFYEDDTNQEIPLRAVNLETGKMRHFYDDDDVVCVDIVVATRINSEE